MTDRIYCTASRETKFDALGAGPWLDEPDHVEWAGSGATRGLIHVVLRGPYGSTCGYVGVPPGHPWHGRKWDAIADVSVHGGITYSEPCNEHVCHVPAPGEPDALWWVGFDCAHAFDYVPGLWRSRGPYVEPAPGERFGMRYRTIEYACQQAKSLAWQAAKAARWVEHRAAQAPTRHERHKVKVGIVVELRVGLRTRTRKARKLLEAIRAAGAARTR